MVCKISYIDEHDDREFLVSIITRGERNEEDKIIEEITDRYDAFIAAKGDPAQIRPQEHPEELHKELDGMYSARTNDAIKLKDKIRDVTGGYCPLCGTGNTTKDVEHYLPRNKYPELSIFSKNLVPACGACNSAKGSKFIGAEGKLFLNVYYDEICSEPLVKLVLSGDYERFSGQLKALPRDSVEEFNLVTRHIKELKLNKLYARYLPPHYFSLWEECQVFASTGKAEMVETILSIRREGRERQFGPNYWEVLLLNAVLSTPILEYMKTHPCPQR